MFIAIFLNKTLWLDHIMQCPIMHGCRWNILAVSKLQLEVLHILDWEILGNRICVDLPSYVQHEIVAKIQSENVAIVLSLKTLLNFLLSREINHGRVSSIEVDKISMRLLTPSGPSRGFVGPNFQQARPFSL